MQDYFFSAAAGDQIGRQTSSRNRMIRKCRRRAVLLFKCYFFYIRISKEQVCPPAKEAAQIKLPAGST